VPYLAIDTSSAVAVAIVADDGATLCAASALEPRRHAELLAIMISDVLRDSGVARDELVGVVAGTGPAPFTGLRVGLVTAQTLGFALGVPVHGVSSLDALAAGAVRALALPTGVEVLATGDARRREVYWARYRVGETPGIELLAGPGVARAAALVANGMAAGAVVVGRGAAGYAAELPSAEGAPLDPDPADLVRLALSRLAAGEVLPTEPLYLRRPDVHGTPAQP
jgi:tRNA threonylcarbamoyladenosine biosynthesis protein TsaB